MVITTNILPRTIYDAWCGACCSQSAAAVFRPLSRPQFFLQLLHGRRLKTGVRRRAGFDPRSVPVELALRRWSGHPHTAAEVVAGDAAGELVARAVARVGKIECHILAAQARVVHCECAPVNDCTAADLLEI